MTNNNGLPSNKSKNDDKIKYIFLGELLKLKIQPKQWLVEKLIPKKSIVFLGGQTNTYKTFIALEIAIKCSLGQLVFGEFATNKIRVLYIDEENGEDIIQDKARKIVDDEPFEDNVNLAFAIMPGLKFDNRDKIRFEELINELRPDLIIIDSLVRFFKGDENDAGEAKKVFDFIKPLTEKYQLSWLIIHHTRKSYRNEGNIMELRGSSDFGASADIVLMVIKKGKNLINLKQEKNRLEPPIDEISIELVDSINGSKKGLYLFYKSTTQSQDTGDLKKAEKCAEEIKSYIKATGNTEFKTAEVLNEFLKKGFKKNTFYAALKILRDEGFIVMARGTFTIKAN